MNLTCDPPGCPGFRCERRLTVERVALVTKPDSAASAGYAERLNHWLKNHGIDLVDQKISAAIDMIIVLGGDGTLLHIADVAARFGIPVLGINFGTLGFLSDITEEEVFVGLEKILTGKISLENRLMLAAHLRGRGQTFCCLNEIVITKDVLSRVLTLSATADEQLLNTYRADGLIISTPSGSTAWNLSAGGPLVFPGLATTIITPICPFMLSSRPMILPAEQRLRITLETELEKPAHVIIDGRARWKMNAGDTLEIAPAPRPLQLVATSDRDWFSVLRTKLHWGGGKKESSPEKAADRVLPES